MITKEQIEQEAISRYGKYARSIQQDSVMKLIMNAFNYGAEWALEQCPYSKEDMIDLLHFVRLSAPNWIIPDDELVKLWEEQK